MGYYQFLEKETKTVYYAKELENLDKIFNFSHKIEDLKDIVATIKGHTFYINGGFLSFCDGEMPKRVLQREAAAAIIDIFEDFLEEKNIKREDLGNFEDPDTDNAAIIYGSDFDALMNSLTETLRCNEVIIPEIY